MTEKRPEAAVAVRGATLRFWKRYRSVFGLGLVAAVLAGVLIEVVLFMNSNPDYWESAGWRGGVVSAVLRGPLFALGTAGAAFIGGTLAVVYRERALPHGERIPVVAGTLGASVGAAVGWLCLGVVVAVIDGTGYLIVVVWLAVLATLITAVLAGLILSRVARRIA